MGEIFVLGSFPKTELSPLNNLLAVSNWACTSRPITVSYPDSKAGMYLIRSLVNSRQKYQKKPLLEKSGGIDSREKIIRFKTHRFAVFSFLGTLISIVCGFPFLFSCTFTELLSFASLNASASASALFTFSPSKEVIMSSSLMPLL